MVLAGGFHVFGSRYLMQVLVAGELRFVLTVGVGRGHHHALCIMRSARCTAIGSTYAEVRLMVSGHGKQRLRLTVTTT